MREMRKISFQKSILRRRTHWQFGWFPFRRNATDWNLFERALFSSHTLFCFKQASAYTHLHAVTAECNCWNTFSIKVNCMPFKCQMTLSSCSVRWARCDRGVNGAKRINAIHFKTMWTVWWLIDNECFVSSYSLARSHSRFLQTVIHFVGKLFTDANEIFHFQFSWNSFIWKWLLFLKRSLPSHHEGECLQNYAGTVINHSHWKILKLMTVRKHL